MSIIIKTVGEIFTDSTLPVLQKDFVATTGTLASYDAGDKFSYKKQASPISGTDVCKNLMGGDNASFVGNLGFSGGFTTDGGTDAIVLPSICKPGANSDGLIIVWVKPGNQTYSASSYNMFALMDSGPSDGLFAAYIQGGTSIIFTSIAKTGQLIGSDGLTPNAVAQYAISYKKVNGNYVIKVYKNGAVLQSNDTTSTSLVIPANNIQLSGGALSGRNYFVGTFYRTLYDNLTAKNPEDIVALDYETNAGRFV